MHKKLLFLVSVLLVPAVAPAAENWKGTPPTAEITFAGLAGTGIVDGAVGLATYGFVGKKLLDRGFANDVNNQVFIEGLAGGLFLKSSTHIAFGAHLRWDFNLDEDWTFYGLGGFAGFVTTSPRVVLPGGGAAGGEVYPTFGIGAIAHLASGLGVRAELRQSFFGLGITFAL